MFGSAFQQCLSHHARIAEMTPARARFLIILVPLAGDQHDVAGFGLVDCPADRAFPIAFDMRRGRRLHAAEYLAHDRIAVFQSGVVVGDHGMIGEFFRQGAHDRPFALVPIAAAAEHAPQSAGEVFP